MEARAELAKRRVGQILRGKWRIEALLGVGGMAVVYAATHRNGKRVAVKMLHPEICADPEVRARFLREGYAANSIGHPGCVAVLDDDVSEDGAVFVVMELLEGETLDARAERQGGRLPPGEVVQLVDQLLDILAAAHEKGIVHRDLKPENLFLTHEGKLKVLDFGIARLRDGQNQRLTATGVGMGTPAFMPPEQALAKWDEVDARSDLWAVGATMFTLLTGRLVHEAGSVAALLVAIATKPVAPLAAIMPEISPAFGAVVDRALCFEPAHRFPDARAMQMALRAAAAVDSALRAHALPEPAALAATSPSLVRGSSPDNLPLQTQRMEQASGDRGRGETLVGAATAIAPRPRRSVAPLAIGAVVLLGGVAALVFALGGGGAPEARAGAEMAPANAASPGVEVPPVLAPVPSVAPAAASSAAEPTPTAKSASATPAATGATRTKTQPPVTSPTTKKNGNPLNRFD